MHYYFQHFVMMLDIQAIQMPLNAMHFLKLHSDLMMNLFILL